jgi:hypothetical protein
MRVFLATQKDTDPARIEEIAADLAVRLPGATIVDGYTDWKENFHRCGGWNGWAEDVATGRDLNGRHRFDVVISPHRTVGKATAQIIERALEISKPVLYVGREGVEQITALDAEDPTSWKAGWVLVGARRA